ncbi:SDR family NAD(P)-dependent oxidoreductase [Cohaesibacter intestini]|uniref:SDR family NAD(P)-dependent oxidoreductase n=1 Tax=Cohaesibacter intestini TaxID=2211145 RepID=UPI000DEB0045|nr:SDR family NAD(P)-dependent oxidoreductase [Cohaesibacter intestini]
MPRNITVIGASGAIGRAFAEQALDRFPDAILHVVSRSEMGGFTTKHSQRLYQHCGFDLENEALVEAACKACLADGQPDLVLIATGVLHGDGFAPERRLQDLDPSAFAKVLALNLIGPSLILKHLLPRLDRSGPVRIGVISARVGSISDNHLGGWYSYRASKAALNMMVKSASIELFRRNKEAVLVGLHPGTVDSALSQPFQKSVPEGKLFTPAHSAACLMDVLLSRNVRHTGRCYDWAGKEIEP